MSASQPPEFSRSRPAEAATILRSILGLAKRLHSTALPLTSDDLQVLFTQLEALRPFIRDATAVPALLSNESSQNALLSVVAVALQQRLPCFASAGTQENTWDGHTPVSWGYHLVAKSACSCCHELLHCELPPLLAARQVRFALRLLRKRPLQLCAFRLAAMGEALLSLQRSPQQQQQQQQEQPTSAAGGRSAAQAQRTKYALGAVGQSCLLLHALMFVVTPRCSAVDPHSSAELAQEQELALRGSCVLEHTARTLLLLFGSSLQHPDDGDDYQYVAVLMCALDRMAVLLAPGEVAIAAPAGEPAALAAALREVLSGRCAQHAVLVLGVTALCAADGGPSYGLPGELQQRVPLIGQRQRPGGSLEWIDLRLASGRQLLDARALKVMVWVLGSGDRVAPPGRQGALALLLRVGRLVVASGRMYLGGGGGGPAAAVTAVPQEHGGSPGASGSGSGGREGGGGSRRGDDDGSGGSSSKGGGGSSSKGGGGSGLPKKEQAAALPAQPRPPPPPRLELVLRKKDLQPLFSAALVAAMALCFPARPADGPQRAAARAECWRLFAAYTRDVLPLRLAGPLPASPVRHLIDPGRLMPGAALPASPPPSWEAALAGGWLPCLERLLRRSSEDSDGLEFGLASAALGLSNESTELESPLVWRHLAVLLAYGEPRQAAALVATLGKLLRAAKPAQLASTALTGKANAATFAVWALNGSRTREPAVVSGAAAPGPQDAGGPAQGDLPGGEPSAAGRQLARMLSYALCEWLPPLARQLSPPIHTAALCGLMRQQQGLASMSGNACPESPLLISLLLWLTALANRCTIAKRAAAAATGVGGLAGAEGGGGGGGEDRGSCGWRRLLLEEMGAVELLGAALHVFALVAVERQELAPILLRACCAVAVACPRELRAATAPGAGAAPAPLPRFPWRPQLLRALAGALRAHGPSAVAEGAEALAAVLGEWEAGGAGEVETGEQDWGAPLGAWLRVEGGSACVDAVVQQMALALVPVAEARAVLRTCSHPGCVSLAGDSEAEAEAGLLACGRCGAARYCCGACQAAHWRAGHKQACVRRG